MYLLKNIYFNPTTQSVIVEPGIQFVRINNSCIFLNEFWGATDLFVGDSADFSKLPEVGENKFFLSYANEYFVKKLPDGYKNLQFNLSTYQPEKIEGYIIFLREEDNILTDGIKLFKRYPTEAVVVLREGEFLEFSSKKVEVKNGKLVLTI